MRGLVLRAIEWLEVDSCMAGFVDESGEHVEVKFTLQRSAVGIGAWPEPDVFQSFDGTAGEVRSIVSAVVRFCLVAQGELEP